ncbi:hypothetical protein CTM59_10925 [Prevotella intermedia]|jgi:hypothetical protein|uniref:Toll/interleukin-1 receptor domain-containing protein n=1 Tax=Prevotella intermedia TaxID=28131 RepID=A0A2M8TIH7_PREIN|nr:toll/interleukin-1 receptor domain-containing protein [Prevotella intermedia]PJI23738.1 hypothetical protein CTM59_10925 [Prevotella intermedia]
MELYKVTTETIDEVVNKLPIQSVIRTPTIPNNLRDKLRNLIKGERGIINGEQLRDLVFPTGNFDVFISHSHNDLEIASLFAVWLKEKCGLSVFLDSFVWGSADGLLQEIDNQYCKQRNGLYNYHRRNYSTAHIHTMLSMSIMEIIRQSRFGVFINSPHSIDLRNLSNSNRAKTLSPWIYQEIMFMRLFADKNTSTRMFSRENLNESLQITHMVDLFDFALLTSDYLTKKAIS